MKYSIRVAYITFTVEIDSLKNCSRLKFSFSGDLLLPYKIR